MCRSCAGATPSSASQLLAATALAETHTRIPMFDEAVVAFLRRALAGEGDVYFYPNVPALKEGVALRIHRNLPPDEDILALYDDTVLGSSAEGFVLTRSRVAWKNADEEPRSLRFAELEPDEMWADGSRLVLGGAGAIRMQGNPALVEQCADALYVLALSARPPAPLESRVQPSADPRQPERRVVSTVAPCARPSGPPTVRGGQYKKTTAPPPAGVSYAAYAARVSTDPPPRFSCWHCATPLEERSPSCAWCGARRKPTGWRNTA